MSGMYNSYNFGLGGNDAENKKKRHPALTSASMDENEPCLLRAAITQASAIVRGVTNDFDYTPSRSLTA
jgi:hypothetical protein